MLPSQSPLVIPVGGSDDFTACELKELRPLLGVCDQQPALYAVIEAPVMGGRQWGRFGLKSLHRRVVEKVSGRGGG